jgi:hypothetical protein
MKITALVLSGVIVSLAAPALAHHSFAMFERDKFVNLSGVVKEYEWTNPHAWIHIMAPDAQGKAVEWSFEMQSTPRTAAPAGVPIPSSRATKSPLNITR